MATKNDATLKRLSNKELKTLFSKYSQTHDSAIREQIIMQHMPLVEFLAQKFKYRGVDMEDLIQIGYFALIKAVERFDVTRDYQFTTFASPTIIGEIKKYFRDKNSSVRIPRRAQELSYKISQAKAYLSQKLQRPPKVIDIAEYLGVSEEDVLEAMETGQAYNTISLNSSINMETDDEELTLGDILGQNDDKFEYLDNMVSLKAAMKNLSREDVKLLYLRYFKNMSQREVSEIVGVSQMQVSRLERRIINKLREELLNS